MSSLRDVQNLTPEQKRELLARLMREKKAQPKALPLSYAQQRLWFLDQLEPGKPVYNIKRAFRMKGPLDPKAFEDALNEVIRRHESLRTRFAARPATDDGETEPVQVIAPSQTVAIERIDLRSLSSSDREMRAVQSVYSEIRKPFDLAAGPLMRVTLMQMDNEEHVLVIVMHHIISDGWSVNVFFRELAALYDAFVAGAEPPLEPLPIQYADYAVWQRNWLQGNVLEAQSSYWKKHLGSANPLLPLPTDRPRPEKQSSAGAQCRVRFSKELSQNLKSLSRQEGVTLFMLMLAAYKALLLRYTGEEEIRVGTPIAGRNKVETEKLIGFFINTLVLKTDVSGDITFRELLGRVRETALGAYAHQDLPFEKLVEVLQPERSLTYHPLFQVMFEMDNAPEQPLHFKDVKLERLPSANGTSKFDLTVALVDHSDGLWGYCEYCVDLFDAPTIDRMMGHFERLLEGIAAKPDAKLSGIPLLSEAEREQILNSWSFGPVLEGEPVAMHVWFEQQVERTPNALAVRFENQTVTFRELNGRANAIASRLRQRGVTTESLVGLCMERSLSVVAAVIGIWKAGGAYVPMDAGYPDDRLRFMIEDTGMRWIVAHERTAPRLAGSAVDVLSVEQIGPSIHENPESRVTPNNLAYVLFTSGSTGRSKGAGIEHRNLWNYVTAVMQRLDLPAGSSYATVSTFAADLGHTVIFPPLVSGGCLHVISEERIADTEALGAYFEEHGVDCMKIVPSHLTALLGGPSPERVIPRKRLVTGGEALRWDLVETIAKLRPECVVMNHYGPTETTVGVLTYRPREQNTPVAAATVPLGRPIANVSTYVLDSAGSPTPVGVAGELFIGGDGVARGYWNRPDLSAEKFVNDPFRADHGRMYRTGDRARYLSNGSIEFLGRFDFQVKIRGFRVELGEIELIARQHPAVKDTSAIVREDTQGDQRLVLYLVLHPGPAPTTAEWRTLFRQKLPEYMVPSAFVTIDALPLTSNGKLDRRGLPAPDAGSDAPVNTYVAPRDALEMQLTKVWERVLKVPKVGIRDNFFDLGGHSLLAVSLFQQVKRQTGKDLPLATLFQAPTIEQLAEILRTEGWSAPWQSLIAIKPGGSRPPLFCVHGIGGNIVEFVDLQKYLHKDQPFYGLQAVGLDGKTPRHTRVEDMAAHYINEVRGLQPNGPYYLSGSSFGGVVAFEMARQLTNAGERVGLVVLFDTCARGYPAYLPNTTRFKQRAYRLLERIDVHSGNVRLLPWKDLPGYVLEKMQKVRRRWRGRARYYARQIHTKLGKPIPRHLQALHWSGKAAAKAYQPEPFHGKLTLFRASKQPLGIHFDALNGWGGLASEGIEVHIVPGRHGTIVREPLVGQLAKVLNECLDRAQAQIGPSQSNMKDSPATVTPSGSTKAQEQVESVQSR